MTTQGPLVGSSMTGWSYNLPGYISTSDNIYDGPVNFNPGLAIAKSFGFTIPTGATINSISIVIEHLFFNTLSFYKIGLTKDGLALAGSSIDCFPGDQSDSTETITGLFGTTWSAEEINAASFGVALLPGDAGEFGGDWFVDLLTLTVDYTATAATVGAPKKIFNAAARAFSFASQTRNFIFKAKQR